MEGSKIEEILLLLTILAILFIGGVIVTAVVGALKVEVKRRDKYIKELEKEKTKKEPNL